MKALDVLGTAAKKVVAAIAGTDAAAIPASRHAIEELERRAAINARGAALREELFGGGRWIRPRPGWLRGRR